jgi:cytochrome bd-type quinol oxidase subunit 2
MTHASLQVAGILLITVAAVAGGGYRLITFIASKTPGYLDNPTRRALWTAGHAHAGVLVVLSLVAMLYIDQTDYSGGMKALIRTLIVAAPILMPLGFFLSIVRPSDTKPNGLLALTYVGGASLVVGTLMLGIGLL